MRRWVVGVSLGIALMGSGGQAAVTSVIDVVVKTSTMAVARCYAPMVVYITVTRAPDETQTTEQLLIEACSKAQAIYKTFPVVPVPDPRPVIESWDGTTWTVN